MTKTTNTTTGDAFEVAVTRQFTARPELVFDAWVDSTAVCQWLFSSGDGEIQHAEIDVRPGGQYRVVERRGEEVVEHVGHYVEIEPPRKILFTVSAERDETPSLVTVEIVPDGTGCEVRLTQRMDTKWADHAERARTAWAGTLVELDRVLAGIIERTFTMTRVFAAPRDLVWQVWTDCQHLRRWWGPEGWSLTVCKLDFRTGGTWHYGMKGPGPEGVEMESWGRALYQEIVAPERIVYTDAFSDEEGNIAEGMPQMLITLQFEEVDGGTRIHNHTRFASAEELQGVLDMGMETGVTQMWDRLDTYLSRQVHNGVSNV